jgi:NAD(P)-dependent dehydrogenase (short-subunit alcohol dehydrogenase family)
MTTPNSTTSAFRIDGKVALITGGASGLGLAGAKALLDAGATGVTLVDLNPHSLEAVTQGSSPLAGYESKVHVFSGDVGDERVNEGMMAASIERWERAPEVVVLCAGISQDYQVPLAEMPEEVWDKVIRVNLKGCEYLIDFGVCGLLMSLWVAFLGLKHAAKAMLASPEGGKGSSIILISSQLGLDGMSLLPASHGSWLIRGIGVPNAGAYSASKVLSLSGSDEGHTDAPNSLR